jgi:hypothetical protein
MNISKILSMIVVLVLLGISTKNSITVTMNSGEAIATCINESTSFDISTKAHRSATVQFAFAKDRPTLPSRGKKNRLSIALFR